MWDREFNVERMGWEGICWHGRFSSTPCREPATYRDRHNVNWIVCAAHKRHGNVIIENALRCDDDFSWFDIA